MNEFFNSMSFKEFCDYQELGYERREYFIYYLTTHKQRISVHRSLGDWEQLFIAYNEQVNQLTWVDL